ncbi:MAG: cytochrome P450, partial [Mycobacteriaceae bacterium]
GSVEVLAVDLVERAIQHAEQGDGRFDLVEQISAPLPLRVICDMMGVPPEDHELVLHNTNIVLSGGDPEYIADENEMVRISLEAGAALAGLMTRMSEDRVRRPTEDLTSALVHAEVDGERLTHQEIASFFILLCVAGNDTTRTAISHGVLALSQFPQQRERWMADEALTKTAVEEIVRWSTPVTWMRRTATRDVELAGQQFREGDKFLLFYNSANRDEDVFADPFVFDLGRSPNPHLGFGGPGPHFCLGANLARREIAVVFRTLFALMPELEVVGEPARLRSSFINGIKSLPVIVRG